MSVLTTAPERQPFPSAESRCEQQFPTWGFSIPILSGIRMAVAAAAAISGRRRPLYAAPLTLDGDRLPNEGDWPEPSRYSCRGRSDTAGRIAPHRSADGSESRRSVAGCALLDEAVPRDGWLVEQTYIDHRCDCHGKSGHERAEFGSCSGV